MVRFIPIPKKENLFEKIGLLKEKFVSFFQSEKKVKAIENFTGGQYFPHKDYLTLIKRCMNDGFLEEKEAGFLDHMLSKYEINYLEWSHRTKWIKEQIEARKAARITEIQEAFEFEKPRGLPTNIPTHLIGNAKTGTSARV